MTDQAEPSADYCYRHPDRQSWILCQRCGRTICPECQIQAAVGVQCPECVREANGGAGPRWMPAAAPPNNVSTFRRRPRWQRRIGSLLAPGTDRPMVSIVVVAATVLVFIADLVTQNLVGGLLVGYPGQPFWQLWRFFTSALVAPSILSLLLNAVFFMLIGPTIERMMGRAKFATVLAAGAAVGASAMLLSGGVAIGLSGAMFGMFAAYFVIGRSMNANMTQFLIIMGLNVVLTLVLSPAFIFMLIGGALGGGGAAALFFYHRDKGTRDARLPYLQIAGGVAAFIVLALIRTALVG